MADTVANVTVFNTPTNLVVSSTFAIDGTEAADLVLVDKSTFTGPDGTEPGKLVVEKLEYSSSGSSIQLEVSHDSNNNIALP